MFIRQSIILFTTLLSQALYHYKDNPTTTTTTPSVSPLVSNQPKNLTTETTVTATRVFVKTTSIPPITVTSTLTSTLLQLQPSIIPVKEEGETTLPVFWVSFAENMDLWSLVTWLGTFVCIWIQLRQQRRNVQLDRELEKAKETQKSQQENFADLYSIHRKIVEQEIHHRHALEEAREAQSIARSRAERAEMETLHARERAALFAERHIQMMELTERHQQEIKQLEYKLKQTQLYCENLMLGLPSMLWPSSASVSVSAQQLQPSQPPPTVLKNQQQIEESKLALNYLHR